MTGEALHTLLSRALLDGKLSRSEQRSLETDLAQANPAASERAELRAHVFAVLRGQLESSVDQQRCRAAERLIELLCAADDTAPPRGSECYFSPGEECRGRIERALEESQRRADICVFTITDDRLSRRIEAAHRRGVHVRVITDNDKAEDRGSDIERFIRAGIDVRVDQTSNHMHHKFAIFDRELVLTGSYNWTRSASRFNQENIALLAEPSIIRSFEDAFDDLWAKFG